jgi:hypothetical protein
MTPYLKLAQRRNLPLAAIEAEPRAAAGALKVPCTVLLRADST